MASEIVLSPGVRNNLLALQNTAKLLERTQTRLATGLKVTSALDDPTAFFSSENFKTRAGDLQRLLDSVGLAVRTLEAADNGIGAITKLVETAQATVRQALHSKSTTAVALGTQDLVLTDTLDAHGFLDGDTIEVNATTITVATAGTYTVQNLLNDLNAITGISASLVNGRLRIEQVEGSDLTLGEGTQGTTNLTGLGLVAGTIPGAVNATRQNFAEQYNRLLAQIDDLAQDSGFNGVNLLKGDVLQVIFNGDASSVLNVVGVDFDSAGLGLDPAANDFQNDAAAETALDQLAQAMDALRAQASALGSNLSVVEVRQEFTKSLINTLETASANLTVADVNEEGANMLALQTRQQLSSVALSLAAQADQNVLRLFR